MKLNDNELVSSVIHIGRKELFALTDVQGLLPLILKITEESSRVVNNLITRLEALPASDSEVTSALEEEINTHIKQWHLKIKKLGGVPKGLWLADFDFGQGYFCWKYPEAEIKYWHDYNDGFTGRKELSELISVMPQANSDISESTGVDINL